MHRTCIVTLRYGRKGADDYHDAPRSFRMILGRSVRNTVSLFFSFTSIPSMREASFACMTRAITLISTYVWQSRIRFSSRGEAEIAEEEIGARYRDGRALSGRADALKRTSAHAPRARLFARLPWLSSSLGPSSSFFLPLRRDPGGRKRCAGHVHSSHGEECNVNYLAARSGPSARERAGAHARASLIELLTRV